MSSVFSRRFEYILRRLESYPDTRPEYRDALSGASIEDWSEICTRGLRPGVGNLLCAEGSPSAADLAHLGWKGHGWGVYAIIFKNKFGDHGDWIYVGSAAGGTSNGKSWGLSGRKAQHKSKFQSDSKKNGFMYNYARKNAGEHEIVIVTLWRDHQPIYAMTQEESYRAKITARVIEAIFCEWLSTWNSAPSPRRHHLMNRGREFWPENEFEMKGFNSHSPLGEAVKHSLGDSYRWTHEEYCADQSHRHYIRQLSYRADTVKRDEKREKSRVATAEYRAREVLEGTAHKESVAKTRKRYNDMIAAEAWDAGMTIRPYTILRSEAKKLEKDAHLDRLAATLKPLSKFTPTS